MAEEERARQSWSSSVTPPLLAGFEEPPQRRGVRPIGSKLNRIDARRAKQAEQLRLGLHLPFGESFQSTQIAGIDFDDFPSLRILQYEPAQRRQFQLKPVGDLHRYDVVTPIRLAQRRERCLAKR